MRNLKLSMKLGLGFAVVLTILVGLLGLFLFTSNSVTRGYDDLLSTEAAIADHAGAVQTLMLQCRRNEKDFLLHFDLKYLESCRKNCVALNKEAEAIESLAQRGGYAELAQAAQGIKSYAHHYIEAFEKVVAAWQAKGLDEKSGLQGEFRQAAHELEAELARMDVEELHTSLLKLRRWEKDLVLHDTADNLARYAKARDEMAGELERGKIEPGLKSELQKSLAAYTQAMAEFNADRAGQGKPAYDKARAAAHDLEQSMERVNVPGAQVLYLTIRRHEKDYLLRQDARYFERAKETVAELRRRLSATGLDKGLAGGLGAQLDRYDAAFAKLVAKDKEIAQFTETMRQAVHKVEPEAERIGVAGVKAKDAKAAATRHTAERGSWTAMVVGISAVVLGIVLAWLIARSIAGPIRRIASQLSSGASQVASAANQVAGAGQALAEGASEQAASLEETSAALEQMSTMTKQSTGNAQRADALMAEARQVVDRAYDSMQQLKQAMERITAASDETAKIIKTIDEISFQTNLLALNAAVEAARAGEAGAGFAVVAEEVRNLAMRAAEAAKNTAGLIEGNLKNIKDGALVVDRAHEEFDRVRRSSAEVAELVGEIAGASGQQSQGIDQISNAALDMDKVTQQVAANAEESAAAAEELSSQCQTSYNLVQELTMLVEGEGGRPRAIDHGIGRPAPKALPAA